MAYRILDVTKNEIDQAVLAYKNSSISSDRIAIDTSGFDDTSITNGYLLASKVDDVQTSLNNINNQYELIQYFTSVPSGTSGTLSIPTGYTIELNRFGNGVDAVVTQEGSDSKPIEQVVRTSAGAIVTTTLDSSGNYVFSGTPSGYPVDIIFYIKGKRSSYTNLIFGSILSIFSVPISNSYTGTSTDVVVTEKALSDGLSSNKLVNRLIVGENGNYVTIKEAVDWFNSNATTNMEILLDAGSHLVTDTITVNDSSHELQIRGLGSNVSIIEASTGLLNKPMFVFKTPCSINKVTLIGSTLESYGSNIGENAINFDTLNDMYSEVTDIIIDTFNIGIYDTAGTRLFLFNFWMNNCSVAGYRGNTSSSNLYLDCEVGSFYNNAISVDLLKANTGGFLIDTLTFDNVGSQVSIKYTGGAGNFINEGVCQITGCSYNFTGTFITGFDFTLASGRDANVILMYNTGQENKNPHAKINVLNNSSTTTITSPGTFYKAVYVNTSSYTCKWTIANNKVTYQPLNSRDVMMWVSCNVISTQLNRNIDIAIVKNGNTALGLFGQMTCRVTAANVPFAVSTPIYLPDVAVNDYYEIWVTNSGTGDVVLQDVSWLIDSK